ncbi:3-hydroxybutyryl-CoA dehydrogenase [Microbacterium sp. cf046]|uniref:3-hydroxyacyl-CoA dehydrogenase family protein n=1 Tax=Microbacterium sp. cf046 TaxID=1761803 RepID=UPI0008F0FB79|nr:3-hydroxyacyl-CoA dehydrogenase family protein [Microbacterium sp. cf046]SFR91420.1 3-hydroxybutyryl-CoA dehydrogenase [Microbacterium sp. cf046]
MNLPAAVVGIAGLGTMGLALAELFVSQNIEVRGFDPRRDAIASDEHPWSLRDNFSLSSSLGDCVRDVDLAIEAVVEDVDVKNSVLAEIALHTEGIIASNTSTFMPSVLAPSVRNPERFLVAHFFNPPQLVPLVEIVPGPATSTSATAQVVDLLSAMGRHPVLLQKECPGFVANRLQAAILREALALVDAGIASPGAIDDIVKSGLAPRWAAAGPIGVADLGGLDIWARVSALLFPLLSNTAEPSARLSSLTTQGHLGSKTGQGFYEHDPKTDAMTFRDMERHFELGVRFSPERFSAS